MPKRQKSARRKRGLPKDDNAYDNNEEEPNDGKSSNPKRTRTRATSATARTATTTTTTNDLFSIDVVATTILSFLDVRELLTVSATSRSVRQDHISYEHVVRAALTHGKHAKATVERVVQSLRGERQIFTPTPLRLLRLLNGKWCESCGASRVNIASELGLFLCWGCRSHGKVDGCMDRHAKKVADNDKWAPFLNHPRVATQSSGIRCGEYMIARRLFRERATGDPVGPLIGKDAMEKVRNNQGTMEKFLERADRMDTHAHRANEIVGAYDKAVKAARKRLKEQARTRRQSTKTAVAKKTEKITKMIRELKDLMVDGGAASRWKDAIFALSPDHKARVSRPLRFQSPVLSDLLDEFIAAPSKLTKSTMRELAETIVSKFEVLEQHREIMDFWFLSDSDPMESALLGYFQSRFPHQEHLACFGENSLEKIGKGELLEAMEGISGYRSFEMTLVPLIADSVTLDNDEQKQKARTLAASVWNINRREIENVRDCFDVCVADFPTLYQKVLDFLNSGPARAWVRSRSTKDYWSTSRRDRAERLGCVWSDLKRTPQALELLLNDDHDGVLNCVLWRYNTMLYE